MPSNIFRRYMKNVIDLKNIETIMKLKYEGIVGEDIMEFYIPGGIELDQAKYRQLANSADVHAALDEMQQMSIFTELRSILPEISSISQLILVMDRCRMQLANEVAHMYPLSVIPVVEYMIHKEEEVRKIRTVAHGVDSGVDKDSIKNMLVM